MQNITYFCLVDITVVTLNVQNWDETKVADNVSKVNHL